MAQQTVRARHTVRLFFRKRRPHSNFSIEASFARMVDSFPADSPFTVDSYTMTRASNRILPRIQLTLEGRGHTADINHVTGDVHFITLGMPAKRTILTIHDCGLLNHPNPLMRRFLKTFWIDLPVRHCRFVTAVSEATRQEILRLTGCDPDKVVVIPTIIPDTFRRDERPFNSERPRILHIGMARNKNLERHAAALRGLNCRLHIVGKLRPEHEQMLKSHRIDYSFEHDINQEQMQAAYADSDLMLFASTLEGFGMPIIEAQTVGRPVVTSNISSMPEVAGDSAVLVDPHDVDSIRRGVVRLIEDAALREDCVRKGYANTERYRADGVARAYEALYQRVIDGD